MKRIIAFTLMLILLSVNLCTSAIAESPQARDSAYFTSYGTGMSAIGNGKIYINFKTVGTCMCSQLGVASYSVQRLDDDGNWEDISGLLSGQTGVNVASYTFGRYFQGVAGETYRLQVTFFCSIGTSSEHKAYTSGKITAK